MYIDFRKIEYPGRHVYQFRDESMDLRKKIKTRSKEYG